MIKDRIMEVLKKKGVPIEKTFSDLGVTSSNFRSNAAKTPVSSDFIANLFAMFPDINLEWLITGEGLMFKTNMVPLDCYTEVVRENERLRNGIISKKKSVNKETPSKTHCKRNNKSIIKTT